ncbi:hypothetical protein ABN034_22925 [Actinopolymorpha sp. B11F2]|uniref:hypothetical protein n=1 Tax=Actinopolymorpha sp. B11F2 TaxID=3160862 RepID=UPI0032E408B0
MAKTQRRETPRGERSSTHEPSQPDNQSERLRRRAAFLRDLAEARELRARIRPRRTRLARLRDALRRSTYRTS